MARQPVTSRPGFISSAGVVVELHTHGQEHPDPVAWDPADGGCGSLLEGLEPRGCPSRGPTKGPRWKDRVL